MSRCPGNVSSSFLGRYACLDYKAIGIVWYTKNATFRQRDTDFKSNSWCPYYEIGQQNWRFRNKFDSGWATWDKNGQMMSSLKDILFFYLHTHIRFPLSMLKVIFLGSDIRFFKPPHLHQNRMFFMDVLKCKSTFMTLPTLNPITINKGF